MYCGGFLNFSKRSHIHEVRDYVRIHLTTGESATKHGQAIRMSFTREFLIVQQMHTVDTNFLMKPVRDA